MITRRFASLAVVCLVLSTLVPAADTPQKPVDKKAKDDAKAKDKAKDKEKDKDKEKEKDDKTKMKSSTFGGLAFRGIGPAMISGRITDVAVDPRNNAVRYITAASGNVWKTTNAGTTWTPIFDDQGSYSIGCITLDPKNPLVVWLGTGENDSQRSVSYGDGIYKSTDGGASWENMGLKDSQHISKILVDPRDSNIVLVAAQGPLWNSGGDRGLYRTDNGGKTWKAILTVDENTGITDVAQDPRNPDVLYAAAYQRRRHVWTLIDGGPGSGIWKSVDGGTIWKKLENGLPKSDMGRIGLAIAPSKPDTVYAVVEAANKEGGFFRSTDQGGNWTKQGGYSPSSPQYYNEIFVDPKNESRVYAMDTWMQVTEDAGKSFHKVGEKYKHVDNHVLWIDPENTDHLIDGCDGGLYETWDRAATWTWSENLPLAQFYKVALDTQAPFYNVYGGTQDNNSLGGPSRTMTVHGIVNSDWYITTGGDGFQTVVDPTDPNIVYSEAQHGALVRYDKRTGEQIDVQPFPAAGEPGLRWNWDSPLIISPHDHARLYFAAQRVFRSDDRGDTWRPVSPDLTRQTDRNQLKVMGRVQSVDAVAKNASTSFYGNIVALSESFKKEGVLAVGTDDGLIQISDDGGNAWRKTDKFPGVPDESYVSRVIFSQHDASTMYASFDNHKKGDFKPYVVASSDTGRSWKAISGNLPERGTVYALAEDPTTPDLLFAGTEFGVFFTVDRGAHWIQLKGGLPTIQVRDLAIQAQANDLVLATFGRGFYILDDYRMLRGVTEASLGEEAKLYPVRNAWMYIPKSPGGGRDKGFNGDRFFTAPNPPFGAVVTYYLKDELKTLRKTRLDDEKAKAKKGEDTPYPGWDALRKEDREQAPAIILTIKDHEGNVVRRLTGPVTAGFSRVAWDLRYPAFDPTNLSAGEPDPWDRLPVGPLAAPGRYSVSMAKRVGDVVTPLGAQQEFEAVPVGTASLPAADRKALLDFEEKSGRLQRAVLGAQRSQGEAQTRIDTLEKALMDTPGADPKLLADLRAVALRLKDIDLELNGDATRASRNESTPPSLADRVQAIVTGGWDATSAPTATQKRNYEIAATEFKPVLDKLRTLILTDLTKIEAAAEAAGAPWTPGRVPDWKPER
ncbi:MAG TPA: hypothetical protein VFV19_09035 [Candidatus Polarisedimenticolaceae bacterium]|nr:hypothetical protein [Candidatus Polarisedimenticolaceae bacterium]